MVVKQLIESDLDQIFLEDSYGYRPKKSALDAVDVTRKRCWKYDWILEFDIRGLFDNIDHELLLRAVRKYVTCKWALLYIERWLKAPMVKEDGTTSERNCGTPQGGVMTPRTQKITSNLSGGCGFCGNRVQIDVCRIRLYVYGRCHAPARLRKPSASIVRVTCCCMSINSPMRSSSWRRTAP